MKAENGDSYTDEDILAYANFFEEHGIDISEVFERAVSLERSAIRHAVHGENELSQNLEDVAGLTFDTWLAIFLSQRKSNNI